MPGGTGKASFRERQQVGKRGGEQPLRWESPPAELMGECKEITARGNYELSRLPGPQFLKSVPFCPEALPQPGLNQSFKLWVDLGISHEERGGEPAGRMEKVR